MMAPLQKFAGSCHCENITLEMEIGRDPATLSPRACDCDFCSRHAATYISDPDGKLTIRINAPHQVSRYRQGSGTAVFLLCSNCGVLAGVYYETEGRRYAAVNGNILFRRDAFGVETPVSPKALTAGEKTERWQHVWFPDVEIIESDKPS